MKIIFLALLFLCSIDCYAVKPKWRLGNMEIGGVRYKPTDTSWDSSAFIDLAWTPMWDLDGFAIHGSFEISSSRDRQTNRFLVTGYQGFALLHVYTIIALEAGGGFLTWHSTQGGTFPIFSTNLCLRVAEESFDRIYVGYGYYFHSSVPAHIVRAGTSFTF